MIALQVSLLATVRADFDLGISYGAALGVQSKLDQVWKTTEAVATAIEIGLGYAPPRPVSCSLAVRESAPSPT